MAEVSCDSCSGLNFLYSAETVELCEGESEPQILGKGRKRTRNPDNWKAKHVKKPGLRKNAPRTEISCSTNCCKKECLKKFSTEHLEKIRKEFEELLYDQQNLYLNGLLQRHQTKKSSGHTRHETPAMTSNGKRLGRPPAEESVFSLDYYLRNESKIDIKVCQKAFCLVFGFGPKRLLVLRQKIKASDTSIEPDMRGKHSNRHRVGKEICELIRTHILSFPSRSSHYSRRDNQGRTYLPSSYSISRLYKDFLQKHDPEYVKLEEENLQRKLSHQSPLDMRKPVVSEHFYRDIFVNDFNIHFGYPRTDTCSTCDGLLIQIDEAASEEDRIKLKEKLDQHKVLAQAGYDTFHYDQDLSRKTWAAVQDKQ